MQKCDFKKFSKILRNAKIENSKFVCKNLRFLENNAIYSKSDLYDCALSPRECVCQILRQSVGKF